MTNIGGYGSPLQCAIAHKAGTTKTLWSKKAPHAH